MSSADALTWIGSNIGAPVISGVAAGLAVALALTLQSVPREVRDNDRQARDLGDEFRRFVSVLSRDVERVYRTIHVDTLRDRIVDRVEADSDEYEQNRPGRIVLAETTMEEALWRYRDQALSKRSAYVALAASELRRHGWYRSWRQREPEPLRLSAEAIAAIRSWRRRPSPIDSSEPTWSPGHDATKGELEIEVFETEEGLTWDMATSE